MSIEYDEPENEEEIPLPKEEKKTIRDCLYGRIHVSLKTMDCIIGILILAIVVSLICGIIF